MTSRIHIVVDEDEKERFRREAERRGRSLSAWLREAAREKLARQEGAELESVEALRSFFERCDAREERPEPDWERHRRVIDRSRASGAADA